MIKRLLTQWMDAYTKPIIYKKKIQARGALTKTAGEW